MKQSAELIATAETMSAETRDALWFSRIDVAVLNPLYEPDWDRMVLSHAEANFFHSAAWAKILNESYGHQPFYLSLSREGQLVALIPMMEIRSPVPGRRGVCLPFSDFCEPLIFNQSGLETICDRIEGLARNRNWRSFEIRGGRGMLPSSAVPARTFYGHKISLCGNSETLMSQFAAPVRRAIRKAQKSDLTVEIDATREAVLQFYRLHMRTRRRHGIPPQPLRFFLNIYKEAVDKGLGFVVLVKSGGAPVAAAVFLQFGRNAVYKFGASNTSYQEFRGNNLAMWEAIQHLAGRGCQLLHLGRTDIANTGLRRFKMGWGAQEEVLEYFKFDMREKSWENERDGGSKFYNKIFRRLPLVLNRFAGSVIYPYLD